MSAPAPDPEAVARKRTGIGVGLGDDLRAIRTSLIKAGLALYFDAAFDLCLFQMARAVFAPGYRPHALDITVVQTPDRPIVRRNDEDFATMSPGEAMLERNRNGLPLDWLAMEDDPGSISGAVRVVRRAETAAVRLLRGAHGEQSACVRALGPAGNWKRRWRGSTSISRGSTGPMRISSGAG